ncbi:HAD-IB family hydrolase [Candidatus Beckwithbacteria bacterium]|nr:HAD-IB family hydrolase [Candidatus Beckwithbacteria bacterium]
MKQLMLFDIDQTIFDGYTIFPLTKAQFQDKFIDFKTMELFTQDLAEYKVGLYDYEKFVAVLLDHWAKGLAGQSYQAVFDHSFSFFKKHKKHFFSYFSKVVKNCSQTHDIFLVTGEPDFLAASIAKMFNVKGYLASQFELNQQGLFTGKVSQYLATKKDKKEALDGLFQKYSFKNSYAFGDSEADIQMLSLVEHPICVNPGADLEKIALKKAWSVIDPETFDVSILK